MQEYTEQGFVLEEVETLFLKYLGRIIQDFDFACKKKIKRDLENLYDIVSRYSFIS